MINALAKFLFALAVLIVLVLFLAGCYVGPAPYYGGGGYYHGGHGHPYNYWGYR